MTNWIRKVIEEQPKLKRGVVWCRKCGQSLEIDTVACFKYGFPMCCGETMTIDSPEEQKQIAG